MLLESLLRQMIGGRMLYAGDEFLASEAEAHRQVTLGWARVKSRAPAEPIPKTTEKVMAVVEPEALVTAQTVPTKRKYTRRQVPTASHENLRSADQQD